jgi:hypothetical protein
MMFRVWIPVGLTIATLILPGCANRQQVDLTQWRDYRPDRGEESPSRTKVAKRSQEVPSAKSAASSDMKSVGTVGRGTGTVDGPKYMRPWPKRGTPEFEQLQAEEAEREARIRDAIHSICRGC